MRFDLLFDDLSAQLDAEREAQGAHDRAEQQRLRAARTTVRDRVAALAEAGAPGRALLTDGSSVELAGATVGRDWFAAELQGGAEVVVPLASVVCIALDEAALHASRERMPQLRPEACASLPGIGVVLRDLARRRIAVDVLMAGGGTPLHGTIERVGSDHLDLAVHERDAAPRRGSVVGHRIVPLSSVALLRL